MKNNAKPLFILLGISLILSSCGSKSTKTEETNKITGEIRIDGSSTVYPITEAVAEEFRTTQPDVKVTVGISGTGGGFKKFCIF
jgi:phosphate transport system substrate-binding protein